MDLPQSAQLHLWFVRLDEGFYQNANVQLLDPEEMKRARKFKFELHSKRFITAHAGLRSILSLYLELSPQNIQILTSPEGKPYVANSALQFNLSHSHDVALYALGCNMQIGVDIEKIRSRYNDAVAERFFSDEEYAAFSHLPVEAKRAQFFRIWTAKEALVKALGTGLRFPLSSFSIPPTGKTKTVQLGSLGEAQTWHLENLDLFPDYQAAIATDQSIQSLSFFEWGAQGKKSWREDEQRNNR